MLSVPKTFLPILFSMACAHAAEVDNYTLRHESFEDALTLVNAEVNRRLDGVVEKLNAQSGERCSQDKLWDAMEPQFRRAWYGVFEEWLYKHPTADVKRPKLKDTIYHDYSFLNVLRPFLGSRIGEVAGLVMLGGHTMGTDKLGHFFDEGWEMYATWKKSGKVEEALAWSNSTEDGVFGLGISGIKSYADMVANFQGMSFWATVSERGLDGQQTPYLTCAGGHWARARDFDMSAYVDAGFDEGINCNQYKDHEAEQVIRGRLEALEARTGRDFHCPVAPQACSELVLKYGAHAKTLLHPSCLNMFQE